MVVFEATVLEADRGGAYVQVPPEVVASLGGQGRIPVRATFDGISYEGSIVSMGDGMVLGVLKSIRAEIRKEPGDVVAVTVELDKRERSVEVPDDLRAALARAGLHEKFTRLSYSHQREHVAWIEDAKKPETRARRIDKTIEGLASDGRGPPQPPVADAKPEPNGSEAVG